MMIKEQLNEVLDELKIICQNLDESQLQNLKQAILSANKIFVAGAGRSLLMIRCLAMRLMHMGFTAYVVGETVTPALEKDDLLIIASGSGNTSTLVVMAEKCKQIGAKLALLTTMQNSKIGIISDMIVHIECANTKTREGIEKHSVQLGANSFEQCVLIICDALVTNIVSSISTQHNNMELMKKHANLE